MTESCPHCRRQVSPDAGECPGCGAPLREGGGTGPLMKGRGKADLALLIMVGLVVLGIVCTGCGVLGVGEPATERITVRNEGRAVADVIVCPPFDRCAQENRIVHFEGLGPEQSARRNLRPPWEKSGEFLVHLRTSSGLDTEESVDREGPVTEIVVTKSGVR